MWNCKKESNFHKRSKSSDEFDPQCKFCIKKFYVGNRDRLLNKQKFFDEENSDRRKEYQLKNHFKIFAREKIYSINRYKTDINFRLICRTRSRIREALQKKI